MNSCRFNKDIIAYRIGLLSGAEKAAFEDHLRTCTFCQHEIQVEAALDRDLAAHADPGDIESFIISKVRLLRNIQPRGSWQYLFQVGAYVAATITLLWVFVPWILNIMAANDSGITRLSDVFPSIPSGVFTGIILGLGALFAITSGLLTWKTLKG